MDGKLLLSADALFLLLPQGSVAWKIPLVALLSHRRRPAETASFFRGGGKIELTVRVNQPADEPCAASLAAADAVWLCEVCEEVNQSPGGSDIKCAICGSKQLGPLQVIKDTTAATVVAEKSPAQWTCDVCDHANSGAERCLVCGFARELNLCSEEATLQPCNNNDRFNKLACNNKLTCNNNSHTRPAETMQILLHFTKGGSTGFYEKLTQAAAATAASNSNSSSDQQTRPVKVVGISGLMRLQASRTQAAAETISSAFTDMDSLIQRAGQLLALARQLAAKTKAEDSDSRAVLKDLISSINANTDVDASGARHCNDFYASVAAKVGKICSALQQKSGISVHSLADVYLLYNRSGEPLISPSDLRRAMERMLHSGPWTMKRVHETLCLVPVNLVSSLKERLSGLLSDGASVTALQWSRETSLSLLMAAEELKMAEGEGWLVRDAKRPGMTIAYYWNIFIS